MALDSYIASAFHGECRKAVMLEYVCFVIQGLDSYIFLNLKFGCSFGILPSFILLFSRADWFYWDLRILTSG